jgi:hypothetical protein
VKRGDRDLEGQPGGRQGDAHQDQGVVREPASDAISNAGELGGARAAVDERQAVEERRGAERAHDQVLEARLERLPPHEGRAAHDVQRHRQELERDEQRHQVLGLREQHHAEGRAQKQGLKLSVARFLSRPLRGGLSPRQRHDHGGRGDRDQGARQAQLVEAQRAGDQVLALPPLPDAKPGGRGQRGE